MKKIIAYRIVLALLLVALPIALLPVPADEPASPPSSKAIAAALQLFVDSQSLAGAVTLVADKDKVLSLDAVGHADVGAKTPLIVRAVFWIASMSKPITAAALMMLVDTKRGLITVWMVQHAGFPGNGGQSQGAFRKAPEQEFSK